MSAANGAVGRVGFRAVHAKKGGKFPPDKKTGKASTRGGSTRAIYGEAGRSIDPRESAYWAAKNPNIVLAQEHLNENWVNDGDGVLKPLTSFDEPEAYLAKRNSKLYAEQADSHFELSELVVHLPENLCEVDPHNVSYVLDENGEQVVSALTGEPLTKPRLIPRDMDEARRFFDDAVEELFDSGRIPSREALHLRSDQYSETRPHVQVIFDNYALDPNEAHQDKKPGCLRNDTSRNWYNSRDVLYEEGVVGLGNRYRKHGDPPGLEFSEDERQDLARLAGKRYEQITVADLAQLDGYAVGKDGLKLRWLAGKQAQGEYKLQGAQGQLRSGMRARGWDVELDIDHEREGSTLGKAEAAQAENDRIVAEDRLVAAETENAAVKQRRVDLDRAEIVAEVEHEQRELRLIGQDANAHEEHDIAAEYFNARARRQKRNYAALTKHKETIERAEADLPRLRATAKREGYAEGIAAGERDAADARLAAEQAEAAARAAEAAARAAEARLRAQHQEELENTKADRAAFISGLKELAVLDSHELWDGKTVKQAKDGIAQNVSTQIKSRHAGPTAGPQRSSDWQMGG